MFVLMKLLKFGLEHQIATFLSKFRGQILQSGGLFQL